MSEIENIKNLIKATEAEVVAKRCWFFFHRWTKWVGNARVQSRHCIRCHKHQELIGKCDHRWDLVKAYTIERVVDRTVKANEEIYECSRCSARKRVTIPAVGAVRTEFF